MNFYERHILPHVIDCACGAEAFRRQRMLTAPRARGVALDLGVGTGRNLEHYLHADVSHIVGVDPCSTSLAIAARRAARLGLSFEPVQAGAEDMPIDAGAIDSIVVAFTLCTIPDVAGALREARRVLKSDGEFLFCEHALSGDRGLARLQRACNPLWRRVFGGCQVVRDPVRLLEDNGFRIAHSETSREKGAPAPVSSHVRGVAVIA